MQRAHMALGMLALTLGGTAAFAATPLGRDVVFHVLPLRWTGEAQRLATALRLSEGASVADIGAGSGALIVELARVVGPGGRAFATERTTEQRDAIARRARAAGINITVINAAERASGLPDACCDAITMRMVMHHVAERETFARDLRRALKPGGRVGIIDFAPGALPHLAHDHGVPPQKIRKAFAAAGFEVASHDPDWGGRSYLFVFSVR